MAEILAIDRVDVVRKGGVVDVNVSVFGKAGEGGFVNFDPVLVGLGWHWSSWRIVVGGQCGLVGRWLVVGSCYWLLATTVKVA